jgi:rhodanese-related sulfurtransferase
VNIREILFGKSVPSLSVAEANSRLQSQQPPVLIDVREPGEFQSGHIAGAKLIPLGKLGNSLNKLPKDRDILVVCQSGNRSSSGTRLLLEAGYQAINLTGGMFGWARAGLPIKKGS